MGFNSTIDKVLGIMHDKKGIEKGDPGELACFTILESFYVRWGGLLIWSYRFAFDREQPGNIKMDESANPPKLYIEGPAPDTEIDLLYVSPIRIFPIEVKAYKSKEMKIFDNRIEGVFKTDKSPIHQHEMHMRQLYSTLFRGLPNGDTNYIVPICVFVDEANIFDMRSDWQKSYIMVRTLDSLAETIEQYNSQAECRLNLSLIESLLKERMLSNKAYLPVRY